MCSSQTTGRITSGGGFSTNYPKQNWQAAAVEKYFTTAAAAGKSPIPGYNINGRAYPDISVMGLNYLVMYGGGWVGMAGTSAACPVMAGFISNINAARMAIGKGSVGWVNPALYAHAASFVNDIVTGDNKCSATAPCCPHGYEAVSGWDPASGLGSVDYAKMQAKFLTLGSVNAGSESPTVKPSGAPTVTPTSSPTRQPTIAPTVYVATVRPTNTPTKVPTRNPSRMPSVRRLPTARPTRSPTPHPIARPTVKPSLVRVPTSLPPFKKPIPPF